jgi:uncharacterized membrane protein
MPEHKPTFRRYFLTGLATLLPLWLTLLIVWYIFKWISGIAVPFLAPLFHLLFAKDQSIILVRLSSFFLTIFAIWLVGNIATHIVGRRILLQAESLFIKLPVLRDIYLAARKFIQFFYTEKKMFARVVLVEFPRQGIHSIGFVTMEVMDEIRQKTGPDVVNVFVPTVPNPTTGYLIMVPQHELIPLDMGIEEAFQLIISGGILAPGAKKSIGQETTVPGPEEKA